MGKKNIGFTHIKYALIFFKMKTPDTLFAVTLAISSFAFGLSANADTVKARCDVYHKGEDRVAFTVPCAFSQRQGFVSIRLPDGTRYDLTPVGNEPNKYTDQNGQPAYRESGLGDRGEIFRLAKVSVFVYWDTAPYGQNSGTNSTATTATGSAPEVGDPVPALKDLVGARAGQAENTVEQRGYKFLRSEPSGDAMYSYWREAKTNYCVIIRTANGRYDSIVYGSSSCN